LFWKVNPHINRHKPNILPQTEIRLFCHRLVREEDSSQYITSPTSEKNNLENKYWEIFNSLDEFTALRFTAAGVPPAARRIRILPMN
jgi:hypothetical protein